MPYMPVGVNWPLRVTVIPPFYQLALVAADGSRVLVTPSPDAIHAGATSLPLNLPLKTEKPGAYTLIVQEKGGAQPSKLAFTLPNNSVHFDKMLMNPQSHNAQLLGQGLEGVVSVSANGAVYEPVAAPDHGSLLLHSAGTQAAAAVTSTANAVATLKNGRTLPVEVSMRNPGTVLQLMQFDATPAPPNGELAITLASRDYISAQRHAAFRRAEHGCLSAHAGH